ncbi:MAG: hypothetical protein JWM95_1737 [Gemmatimonadetes bacterium]|nr:hypothetical protein [Gemmatimonadota bacterium]
MTKDDANFLAAADRSSSALCLRAIQSNGAPSVTLSHDEFSEIAVAFERAVQLASAERAVAEIRAA